MKLKLHLHIPSYFYGVLHGLIILVAYSSPLWLDWKIIGIGIALYYLQLGVFVGCVLSHAQFGKDKDRFAGIVLKKLGWNLSNQALTILLDIMLPPCFALLAWYGQSSGMFSPIIHLK